MSETNSEHNRVLQDQLRKEAEFTRRTAFNGGNDRGEADSTHNFRLNPGAATARNMTARGLSGAGSALLIGVVLSVAAGAFMFGQSSARSSRSGRGEQRSGGTRTRTF